MGERMTAEERERFLVEQKCINHNESWGMPQVACQRCRVKAIQEAERAAAEEMWERCAEAA